MKVKYIIPYRIVVWRLYLNTVFPPTEVRGIKTILKRRMAVKDVNIYFYSS
jgi:hypothetical protein